MPQTHAITQVRHALGTWRDIAVKTRDTARTVRNTFRWRMRRKRLERLRDQGLIDAIPNEWQIAQASYQMLTEFILPSNKEFYAHYDADEQWVTFLRFLDAPSTMLDPTGLAISRDLLIAHLLHVVHVSAGYDVGLLDLIPGGLDALDEQLEQLLAGTHPRQDAIMDIIERKDYPARLRDAVARYRKNPRKHWEVRTYDAPEDCKALLDEGLARFGTIGRLMRHAATLPRTPLETLGLQG